MNDHCKSSPSVTRAKEMCMSMCLCVAFGYYRTENSSSLLLCNLIGKIQVAATHIHTHLHTLTYTGFLQNTRAFVSHTNMLNLCVLSFYTDMQTCFHHMLHMSAKSVCVCVCICSVCVCTCVCSPV